MKKQIILLSILCISTWQSMIYADIIDEFREHSYDEIFKNGEVQKLYGSITDKGKKEEVQMIVTKDKKIVYLENKLQKKLILFTNEADAWMMSNKTVRPLKITISQEVGANLSVEDLAGVDIKKFYRVINEISETEVMLTSNNHKASYPFISIKKNSSDNFIITHYDRNKHPLKQIDYHLVTINQVTFWGNLVIKDLVYADIGETIMVINNIEEVTVPESLLTYVNMNKLFIFFK